MIYKGNVQKLGDSVDTDGMIAGRYATSCCNHYQRISCSITHTNSSLNPH